MNPNGDMLYKTPGLYSSSISRATTQSKVEEEFHLEIKKTSKQMKGKILKLMLEGGGETARQEITRTDET